MPPLIPAGNPAAAAATVPAGTIPPGMQPMNRPKKPGPQAKPKQAPQQVQQQPPQGQVPANQPQPQAPGQIAQQQPGQVPAPAGQQQPVKQGPAMAPPPPGVTRGQSGPIPGQSLTSKGGHPYEKPPQYTDPDKAMQAILNSLTDEKTCPKILNLMEIGVPIYAIVTSLIMTGFTEGKWNPDLALLLMEPTTALLIRMAKAAKIEPVVGVPEDEDNTMEQVVQHRAQIAKQQVQAAQDAALEGGIVDRPKPPKGAR